MPADLRDQYEKIYRYCYFRVKNKETAEDLTQEAFLRYFSQKSCIGKGKQLAYLYTVARNLCIDYYRKNSRNDALDENVPGDDNVSAFETNYAVKQAISLLPDDLQELLLLRFANELGINEIANIMKISRFSVYRRLNRALGLLKSILRKEDFNAL